jgi:hypothetical protein
MFRAGGTMAMSSSDGSAVTAALLTHLAAVVTTLVLDSEMRGLDDAVAARFSSLGSIRLLADVLFTDDENAVSRGSRVGADSSPSLSRTPPRVGEDATAVGTLEEEDVVGFFKSFLSSFNDGDIL